MDRHGGRRFRDAADRRHVAHAERLLVPRAQHRVGRGGRLPLAAERDQPQGRALDDRRRRQERRSNRTNAGWSGPAPTTFFLRPLRRGFPGAAKESSCAFTTVNDCADEPGGDRAATSATAASAQRHRRTAALRSCALSPRFGANPRSTGLPSGRTRETDAMPVLGRRIDIVVNVWRCLAQNIDDKSMLSEAAPQTAELYGGRAHAAYGLRRSLDQDEPTYRHRPDSCYRAST